MATESRERMPFILFTSSLGFTLLILVVLVGYLVESHRTVQQVTGREFRLKELAGTITHLNEVLTMSARMAAATGDTAWEQRYRRFEPQLDAAIRETRRLAPDAHSGEDAGQTDAANLKIVEMENASFGAAAAGDPEKARGILFSAEYEEQKALHAAGMTKLAWRLTEGADAALSASRRRTYLAAAMAVGMLAVLVPCWAAVWEALRRWKKTMTRQNRELSGKTAELEELNSGLDQCVADRTEALRREIEQRKQTETRLEDKLKEVEFMNKFMMDREQRILELKEKVKQLNPGGGAP